MLGSIKWRIASPFIILIVVSMGILGGYLTRFVKDPQPNLTLIISLAIVMAAVLAMVTATLIARLTTRPIREVTEASKRIAFGELGQTVPVRSRDETGELSRAFNEMLLKVDNLLGEVSREKNRLETVLANITDAIMMTDTEGRIVLANPASERLFSFRVQDTLAKPLIEVVHDHEADEVLKQSLRTHEIQKAQFESISRRFLRAIAIPIAEGQSGILLLFQDLTELRSLQTMRRELVGNISHELRTPIAGIKVMVEAMMEGAIDDREAAMDFLSRIDGEVDYLTHMVSELTELSRIESGRAELKMAPLSVNLLVQEAVAQLNPLAQRQQVTITTESACDLPTITADKDRIRQTLLNLVHNAIKFNHPGGKVMVSTEANGNFAIVNVSDTGIGISEEDLPRVFERFYKADKARIKGSGLGLAIAKHAIQAHGGNIWAQSEEGKGSTFSLSLPLKANPSAGNQ